MSETGKMNAIEETGMRLTFKLVFREGRRCRGPVELRISLGTGTHFFFFSEKKSFHEVSNGGAEIRGRKETHKNPTPNAGRPDPTHTKETITRPTPAHLQEQPLQEDLETSPHHRG